MTSSCCGIELAREMRKGKSNRDTPIILLSDDQRPSALSQGFEAGASFFLYKPVDKVRLLRLVRATQRQTGHERRQTRRAPFHAKVRLRFGSELMWCDTVSVSLNGILVRAPQILSLRSQVQVSLELTRQMRPLVGGGSVVRIVGGNQMGIHLDQLPLAESERLQEFLLPMIPGE